MKAKKNILFIWIVFVVFFFSFPSGGEGWTTGWCGATLFSQESANSGAASVPAKFVTRPFENKVFIEEQGQFKKSLEELKINVQGTILFAVNNPEFRAYFTSEGITFLFSRTSKGHHEEGEKKEKKGHKEKPVTTWETVNMHWINASPSMRITAKEKAGNYFTYGKYNDDSQYDHVNAYKKLYCTNIFEGVDVEFELPESGGIKYQFIVHAGFSIPDIAYRMDGTKGIFLDEKGDLHIKSEFGELIDKAPVAFTKSRGIPFNYTVTGNRVEIRTENAAFQLTEDLIIDPWITNPGMPVLNNAYDIQEDSVGNVYIYGGDDYNYQVQKYNSAGVVQWTHNTTQQYYGDIAVANSGSLYLAEGITAKLKKLDPTGAVVYSITQGAENWRLSFNNSKTILAMGGNFSPNSLTKIDTVTGLMTNTVSYPSDTWAIATDCNGDIYSLHQGASPCMLRKTDANFTPAGSLTTSPGFCISGYNNVHSYASGFNALTISGPYLYIYDGLQLRRFLKSTLTFVNSVPVANGTVNDCSGIAFDYCGNIYVGTMSTIEKYDMLLNHLTSIPAPNIVYDIILAGNGDLLACGKSFVANMGPTCPSPPQLVATATSTNVSCKPGTATITGTGGTPPYTYTWMPGGQTTATATGLTPGTYTYLVNDAFCQSQQDSVVVLQTLPLSLTEGTIIKESCLNSFDGTAMVDAAGGTGPYSYSWNTNPVQNTQTAIGLPAGTYVAYLADADTCMDTLSVIVTRNPDPVAAFGNTTVCNGNATQFTDSSTTTAGTISSWSWDFGDGSLGVNTGQNPSHVYVNAGNYNVTLIVNNNFGCADTITKSVQVYFNPVAGFTYNDVCFGDTVNFVNTSTIDNSSSITGSLWVFGDSGPSNNMQSPNHYYSNAGTYTVTLVTTTIDGCSNAAIVPVKTFDAPVSGFTFSNICLLDSASFTNTSLNPVMGSTASWSWDFGDGSPLNSTNWNLSHLYPSPGDYLVTLITLSSNLGCADSLQTMITVFPMPAANFSFADVCLNEVMNFNDLSTVSTGNVTGWTWNFGDNTPVIISQNPGHTYTGPGTYAVTLIVSTNNGCKDTITRSVVVHPLPVAQFSTTNVCDGSIVPFIDLSSISTTDTIQSQAWNFGDGSPANNNQNTSHVYATHGSYTVQLLIASNFGCLDSISKVSIIHPNPVLSFSAIDTAGCEPLCVNLLNGTSIATGAIATWLWSFGDGSPAGNSQHADHCYINDSVYLANAFHITLTATSDSGCVSTLSKNNYIVVYPNPVAAFSVQPDITTITDPVISIQDLSTGADFWDWNFGDGTDSSVVFNPGPHTYQDTGSYTITLIVSTQYNCVDTAYETIIIEPDFLFYIPNAFTPNDDGINDSFAAKGIFMNKYEMTIFDRWGNLVFFSDDINKPWDGRANHGTEIAQSDIYVYSINVTDFKKKKRGYKGIVTLVR